MKKPIELKDIKIKKQFAQTTPSAKKMKAAERYFRWHRRIDKNIVLNSNNVLVDGYIRYLVLVNHGKKKTRQYQKEVKKPIKQTYVYGKHSDNGKEFVWRLTKNTKNADNLLVGCKAKVRTKWGIKPITVTKIKELNIPPIKGNIKVVAEVF